MTERTSAAVMIGGCQCGSIRYEITAPPLTLFVCHCRECQKQSSSAFGMSMPVPRAAFVITAGQPSFWQRGADSGRILTCAFCRDCGTRLYHAPAYNPAAFNIKPGTLDEFDLLEPVGHIWTRRALPWLRPLLTGILVDGQPEDFGPFFTAWAARRRA